MAYSKKDAQKARQQIHAGVKLVTETLDASTTVEILELGGAMSRVSFQASGTLAGTVEFSVNGKNWFGSTAIPAANAPGLYNSYNFNSIKVTRSGGEGQLAIAATA